MSPENIELCLEVLSAVAWADAELTIEEVACAVDLLEPMAYSPRHRIEEIFMMPRCLPSALRLRALSAEQHARLLRDAHHVAQCFKGVAPDELLVLRQLRSALAP